MMASIAGYTMLFVTGPIGRPGMATEPITRPGVDGSAFREVGLRCEPFLMTSLMDLEDAADVAAELNLYAALKGSLVTVVDDHGSTWTNVMVLDVQPIQTQTIGVSAGGLATTPTKLITARWTLQATE